MKRKKNQKKLTKITNSIKIKINHMLKKNMSIDQNLMKTDLKLQIKNIKSILMRKRNNMKKNSMKNKVTIIKEIITKTIKKTMKIVKA